MLKNRVWVADDGFDQVAKNSQRVHPGTPSVVLCLPPLMRKIFALQWLL